MTRTFSAGIEETLTVYVTARSTLGCVPEQLRSNVVALSSPASYDHAEPTSATWWLTFAKTHAHVSLPETPFRKDTEIQCTNEIALHT